MLAVHLYYTPPSSSFSPHQLQIPPTCQHEFCGRLFHQIPELSGRSGPRTLQCQCVAFTCWLYRVMTAEKAMLGAFGRGEYAVNSQQGKTAGFCSVRARMFTAPQTYIHINSRHAHTHITYSHRNDAAYWPAMHIMFAQCVGKLNVHTSACTFHKLCLHTSSY